MFSHRPRLIITLCCVLICAAVFSVTHAQSESPQAAADAIRQQLFEAQSQVLGHDLTAAETAYDQAFDLYQTTLGATFEQNLPEVDTTLSVAFEQASQAVQAGDSLELAAARGQIWAGLMQGSALMVFDALEKDDGVQAHEWLLLRDYRKSTKFSRPGADATLAIQGVLNGTTNAQDALQSTRNDLLDTYQAQLTRSLSDADQAAEKGFSMRRAEEAGLALGYFEILTPIYGEQNGDEALNTARTAFTALVTAALTNDESGYQAARQQVDAVLKGFRAAPLSQDEQARRAGQMLRFLSLVPVEYGRGVHDGQVLKDIELQEALTFYDGATAAFADLQTVLEARDSAGTAEVVGLLAQVADQISKIADPADLQSTIDQINTKLTAIFPPEWQSINNDSDVDVIISILDQLEAAVSSGEYALAESARLEAYAMLELGIEQRLRGFAPNKAATIESLFWSGTGDEPGLAVLLGTEAPLEIVKARSSELKAALADAQTFLSSEKTAPEAVVGNAGIIVFREGLEAVLILASLLASLRTVEEKAFRRLIAIGAGVAFLATGVTWWFANQILVSMMQYGERLEAIVSLIAIGVLLLITNWFFHKVYWTGWMAGFHSRKRYLIAGAQVVTISQSAGLIILGFTSVYREGFETVLFLQSLVLEAGVSTVLQGVALGLFGTAIVGFITFKLQVRLPYKRMLVLTGIFIGAVLLTMVGNTVHVMQAVGWIPINPISRLNLPFWMGQWFGLYATWQGIGAQLAAAVFVIGSYFWANSTNSSKSGKRQVAQCISATDAASQ